MTRIGTGAITNPRIELSKTAQKNAARDARKIVNEWHASGIVDVSANCQHPDNAVNDAEAWMIESSRECVNERFSWERSANSDRDVHTRYREEIEHLVIAALGGWNAIADALAYERATHGVNDVCPDCNGNGRTWDADGNRWCTACNTATRIMLAHKPEYPVDESTIEAWSPAYTEFPYDSDGFGDDPASLAFIRRWIARFPASFRYVLRHPDGTGELYPAAPVELAPDTATELETQALIIARVLLVNAGYTVISPNVPPTQDDIAHAVNVLDMSGFDVDFLHSK